MHEDACVGCTRMHDYACRMHEDACRMHEDASSVQLDCLLCKT